MIGFPHSRQCRGLLACVPDFMTNTSHAAACRTATWQWPWNDADGICEVFVGIRSRSIVPKISPLIGDGGRHRFW